MQCRQLSGHLHTAAPHIFLAICILQCHKCSWPSATQRNSSAITTFWPSTYCSATNLSGHLRTAAPQNFPSSNCSAINVSGHLHCSTIPAPQNTFWPFAYCSATSTLVWICSCLNLKAGHDNTRNMICRLGCTKALMMNPCSKMVLLLCVYVSVSLCVCVCVVERVNVSMCACM